MAQLASNTSSSLGLAYQVLKCVLLLRLFIIESARIPTPGGPLQRFCMVLMLTIPAMMGATEDAGEIEIIFVEVFGRQTQPATTMYTRLVVQLTTLHSTSWPSVYS